MKTRRALLILSLLTLLAAMWAGLLRAGWPWPALQPALPAAHGPLMVSGFLGTLIALERAVALRQRQAYLAPLASALGSLLLITGLSWSWGNRLLWLGSLGLLLLFGAIVWRHRALHTAVMALGAGAWLAGNTLLVLGWPIYRAVPWWIAFLVLTIAGERLELSRVLRLSRRVQLLFVGAAAVFVAGLPAALFAYAAGMRLAGLGLLLLAAWLLRYDIARRTVKRSGLTRYIAACLLSGYLWLGAGGLLALGYGGTAAGPIYDAMLHAVFLGFVFAMIFGHAPIIFPAVLARPIAYHPRFYAHLALLHLSLLLRVLGDLAAWPALRRWGALLNVVVLLLFLAHTALALRAGGGQTQLEHS